MKYVGDGRLKKYYLFTALMDMAEFFGSRNVISEMNRSCISFQRYETLIQKYLANCKALFQQLPNF
jgi:hypothetical protein